jgi:RluA family pseudouridine synthase
MSQAEATFWCDVRVERGAISGNMGKCELKKNRFILAPCRALSSCVKIAVVERPFKNAFRLEPYSSYHPSIFLFNCAQDINVVYEDDHIIVVNKPSGVLCVPGKDGFANLAEAVCENFGCEMGSADKMVVHRLGMDTSGLVVFAKTMAAVRGMNTIFRTRKIERKYEALVCGHLEKDEGMVNLPLMRDYQNPPFMRVSTDEHQRALIGLDPAEVGKKLLEQPKDSLTKYEVIAKEEFEGNPVSRVSLTSISGRTHQLNVHMAAFGHPIVGDSTYGIGGDAAPNGGLSTAEADSLAPNASRAGADLQQKIADAAKGKSACVHAKSLKFRHPVTKETVDLSCDAPF